MALEEERAFEGYATAMGRLSAAAVAGGLLALRGRRWGRALGGLGAVGALAAIADDISNGPRVFRRATEQTITTQNVVARLGDPDAPRTLVVLAHHDAAPTGYVFDQTFHRWLGARFPDWVERTDTAIPMWWPVLGGPLMVAAGALTGARRATRAGVALGLATVVAFADIARSPVVPGANDNLTAVAALVALARALRERPAAGLRVLLVSCGAEEVLQGGIHGFAERHFPALDRHSTWVLNLDTLGSPRLILLEGEGPVVMEDYTRSEFRDRVARAAEREGVPLRRNMRARSSTDAVVPSRAGFPTATLASMDAIKALSNYHLMTDVPENVIYETVAGAVRVAEAVIRELADAEG